MCFFSDGDSVMLARHIERHHHFQLSAYMGSMGLVDRATAAQAWARSMKPGARLSIWDRDPTARRV
jgi:hypothetical protein